MNTDVKENMARIIETKMKQLKTQAEKYETDIKLEIRKIINAEKEIKLLNQNITEETKATILTHEDQIKQSRIKIKNLRKDKLLLMECDVQVTFYDDFNISNDIII